MFKLIIFDLDGTLVDAYQAVSHSVNFTLKHMGLPPKSYAVIKRSVGGGDRKLMALFVGEQAAAQALGIYRPHHTKALQTKGLVKLLPGTLSLLKYLKARKFKLAIASNRPTKFTRLILKRLEILSLFDGVLCADKSPRPKPYPDMLWALLKRLKVNKAETLYVGDMDIDIKCGRKAGIKVAAVATGSCSMKELKDLKPWAFIDKIVKLKPIINQAKD